MNRTVKRILIVLLILILSGVIAFAYFIGNAVHSGFMQFNTNEDTAFNDKYRKYLADNGLDLESFLATYTHEKIEIASSLDGHTIPTDYFLSDNDPTQNTVILVHGAGGNRQTVYPIGEMFLKNGFNVVCYDQRSSGENTANNTTFGYLEHHDLADAVNFVKTKIDESNQIGVWGISAGGATAGWYIGTEEAGETLSFAILESPVGNAKEIMHMYLRQMDAGIPISLMETLGSWVTKIRLGFNYDDLNMTRQVAKTDVPTLVIYSTKDELTTPEMVQAAYDAIPGDRKQQYVVEDSSHAEIFFDHRTEYEQRVMNFIRQATGETTPNP